MAAVEHFARELFPRLRRERPTLGLQIVGRRPLPAVRALTAVPGVEVTGEVPSVAPYLGRAWAFVAPLRETVGVPSKIIEAMAAGVPSVASEAAAGGLDGDVQPDRDLLVARDDDGFLEAVDRLLSHRHLRERIGASGRRHACRTYSWRRAGDLLGEMLGEIAPRPRRLGAGRAGPGGRSLRDLAVLAVVFGSLPFIPFRPAFGLGVYAWLAYMRPQDLAWGIKSMQLSMWVAIAILVGLVLNFGRERFATFRLQTLLLIMIGGWFAITCHTAQLPHLSEKWMDVLSQDHSDQRDYHRTDHDQETLRVHDDRDRVLSGAARAQGTACSRSPPVALSS